MPLLDWAVLAAIVLSVFMVAAVTRSQMRSVADFLAANRCAGKYLLTMAECEAAIGITTVIAWMELYYQSGFAATWWCWVTMPVYYTLALTGWIMYRFRETRCLTMAQFFEVRYSKGFRIFAGVIAWLSGLVFFGVFPGIGARFFVVYCGLPEFYSIFGVNVSSYIVVMVLLVGLSLVLTLTSGQIAVLVADFFQGSISNIGFLIIAGFLLYFMSWSEISEVLLAQPPGESKLNPFDLKNLPDFDFWYFAICWFLWFYQWQTQAGAQTFNASARSPHDARMGKSLSDARNWATTLILVFAPVCAYVVLKHPNHTALAKDINTALDTLPNVMSRLQMIAPVFLRKVLPVGMVGLMAGLMFAAFIASHTNLLQFLGSVFIQDVIMPARKTPFSPQQHLRLLRMSIVACAILVCLFSVFYKPTGVIFMFWTGTAAIYYGGAGIVIIGGLYWKRGTTLAAYCAMVVGILLAGAGLILNYVWQERYATAFPVNEQKCALIAALAASTVYIVISLLSRHTFNMDRMLHRGQYAVEKYYSAGKDVEVSNRFLRAFGITKEFSLVDRCVYFGVIIWGTWWLSWTVFGSITYYTIGIPDSFWIPFWRFWFLTLSTGGLLMTIFLLGGGIRDLRYLFQKLKTIKRSALDDGMVIDHRNVGEEELISTSSGDGAGRAASEGSAQE